jgi:hypothetical protein
MRQLKWITGAAALALMLAVIGVARLPAAQACETAWFFDTPAVESCPTAEAVAADGSFMQFENGFMIWSSAEDAIYVLYISEGETRWERFSDDFTEAIPDVIEELDDLAPAYTFQPRRGMGLVWRENEALQARLGWAVAEYEFPYQVEIQTGDDGTVYVRDWRGGVFALEATGADWQRYDALTPAS